MSSSVPKFTSFRPKPKDNLEPSKDPPKPEHGTRSDKSSRDRSSERQNKSKQSSWDRSPHKNRKSDKPSGDRTSERSSHRHRKSDKHPRERTPETNIHREDTRQPDPGPSKVFFSDRRGDRDIVRYGGLNRYDIPDYRRIGYGNILGLALDRKIDRNLSTDKEIVLTSARRSEQRLLTNKYAARERTRAVRFVRRSNDEQIDDHNSDFIAFSNRRKRKCSEDESDDDAGPEIDHRGFHDEKAQGPFDEDAEYEFETVTDSAHAETTARNTILVRRTKDHPEELQAWLDLVEHQELMMKIDRSSTELRNKDKQNLAEIRISIYEQALRRADSNESSQILLYCCMMTDAARIWSETQLASKWTEVLSKFPFSTELWLKYLDFTQSSFTSFKFEACKATLQKCLETMQLSPTGVDSDLCLYIFNRLTSMIYQAGYQELALAIWQAILEFHFFAPGDATQTTREAMESFEEFWESEVPRIGEEISKGWRNFNADDGPLVTDSIPLLQPGPKDTALDDFRKREVDRISKLRHPGRTTDEVGEDDAFHTVLFSDVEAFLKLLPSSCEKAAVISAFLRFCGLPPLLRLKPYGEKYAVDPFLQTELHDPPQESTSGFAQLISKYSGCRMKKFQMTAQLLFDQSFQDRPDIVEIDLVRRVLKLVVGETSDGESIGEYLLALESRYFPGEAFKTAKQLLRARPASLRLYNAYGLVESRRNNSEKADQVFSAALSMQKGDTPFSTPGSLEIYYSWVWEALRQGNGREALWRLESPTGKVQRSSPAVDDETPNQAALLRAQRALSETCERALLGNNLSLAALATSLVALLAYLSGGEKPESALIAFAHLTTWFTSHNMSQSLAAELHAQYIAQFLTYHAEHAPIVKPALLRETLEPLINTFPDNTILLSVYAANEARFAIDDRVRSIMHRNASDKNRSIVGWTFAIHYETLRGEIAGSTSHSIRALFHKAEDDVGAHCPALWKQHVLFEIAEARKEREKRPRKRSREDGKKSKEEVRVEEADQRVKDTFFRGLAHLPWCKTYMMMAFTHLGEFLSQEDFQKVYNVMVEKELRLYVEIEDFGA